MGLLIPTLVALALLLILIVHWKVHAFLALLIAAVGLGVAAGMQLPAIASSIQKGIGDLLGSIAPIIGAGAILGCLIDVSGGGAVVAQRLITLFGPQRTSLAMLFTGYLVGIPVFFDAAFFTLIPLAWALSKKSRRSLLYYALPILASLTITHGLIPTHPGPAAAAQLLGADLGKATLWGLLLGIPSALAGGLGYGLWIANRTPAIAPPELHSASSGKASDRGSDPPSFGMVTLLVLLPVLLIALGASTPQFAPLGAQTAASMRFLGNPAIALLISVLLALIMLRNHTGLTPEALLRQVAESLNSIGSLILIIGASGAFKQVITDSGAGTAFAETLLRFHIPPLLSAFLVGAGLRIALGSATASITAAAGLVAPLAAHYLGDRVLLVMALTTGGSIFANVNDAGFWMVKEYCGMTVPQTLKTYSLMKTITSLVGFALVCVVALFT